MAEYRTRYNVYGYPRNTKRGSYKERQYIGYVKDYNSVYARERAVKEFKDWVVTSVLKDRSSIRGL